MQALTDMIAARDEHINASYYWPRLSVWPSQWQFGGFGQLLEKRPEHRVGWK